MQSIQRSTFSFLTRLSKNNNRAWFTEHKDEYEKAKGDIESFINALIIQMRRHDTIETTSAKESLYRIYNDVRFSKDKTPYNPRFAGYLRREKPFLRGGYYYWIKPGASKVGCGFVYPSNEDLLKVRQDISSNLDAWKKMLRSKSLINTFGGMQGIQLKSSPRGFSKDDPAIELLRYRQYWFERSFTDQEVLAPDFLRTMSQTYQKIRPFFDYMSELLTTDENGVPLYPPSPGV